MTNKNEKAYYEKVATSENESAKEVPKKFGFGVRHIQVLLTFGCITCNLLVRAQLSVTIVAMTDIPTKNAMTLINNTDGENHTESIVQNFSTVNTNDSNNTTIALNETRDDFGLLTTTTDDALRKFNEEENKNPNNTLIRHNETKIILANNNSNFDDSKWNIYKKFSWEKRTQEMILGSFFLGYLIMMTPMGLVVQRWGGKIPLMIGLTVSGIVTFLTPWLAAWGDWKALCATRIVIGLAQTGTYPSIHSLLSKWVPLSERARLGTFVYTGAGVGSILAFQIGGLLAASPLGWPSIFWVSGGLCIIMATLMAIFGAATPMQHKSITIEEKNFILGKVADNVVKRRKTPWKAILTSKHVLATFAAHLGTGGAYMFFFSQIPTYLHYILGINVKSSGLLTSLPNLAAVVMSFPFGYLTDYCINHNILSRKQTRMISNTIANVFPAISLVALSYTSNATVAVALLIMAMGGQAACHTGWMINYIDLSPNFAASLMATGASLFNVLINLQTIFVSQVVTDVRDPHQWRIVMFSLAAFGLISNIIYMFFISTDPQPWDDPQYEATELKDLEVDTTEVKVKVKVKSIYFMSTNAHLKT